jgi:hypothetical protein
MAANFMTRESIHEMQLVTFKAEPSKCGPRASPFESCGPSVVLRWPTLM